MIKVVRELKTTGRTIVKLSNEMLLPNVLYRKAVIM
jgi:hypothetical protein